MASAISRIIFLTRRGNRSAKPTSEPICIVAIHPPPSSVFLARRAAPPPTSPGACTEVRITVESVASHTPREASASSNARVQALRVTACILARKPEADTELKLGMNKACHYTNQLSNTRAPRVTAYLQRHMHTCSERGSVHNLQPRLHKDVRPAAPLAVAGPLLPAHPRPLLCNGRPLHRASRGRVPTECPWRIVSAAR